MLTVRDPAKRSTWLSGESKATGFWSTYFNVFLVLGSYYSYLYLEVYTLIPGSTPK